MIKETFQISNSDKYRLDVYIQDESPEINLSHLRPFVLVCPGGGYGMTSDREADPISFAYLADGFHSGVLRYSVAEDAVYPNPIVDLSVAIRIIRENAEKWHVDPEKIAVVGFSAGGHLAAMQGVHWNDPEIMKLSGCENGENKPNALVLGYPVITSNCFTHQGSMQNLLREFFEKGDKEEIDRMLDFTACEKHVGAHTPPTFILHTCKDSVVPVKNSLVFADALINNNIDFEMHIFEQGEHGQARANQTTDIGSPCFDKRPIAAWIEMSCRWLWEHFK